MWQAIAAISIGASLGAISRWILSINFNTTLASLQPGTLIANLLGGYLIGVGITYFADHPEIPTEWRLFAITGFLGALTTFSTFSAEIIALIESDKILLACVTIALHVGGSLAMTMLGIATASLLRQA